MSNSMEELDENRAKEWWMDHLAGELSNEKEAALRSYLTHHKELEHELHLWKSLGEIETPEPSEQMDLRFNEELQGMLRSHRKGHWSLLLKMFSQSLWVGRLAFAIAGILLGYFLLPQSKSNNELDVLVGEVASMKKLMMLTLIEQPRAQERIQAVSLATELKHADFKVLEVLESTLNEDQSVNVRLAAIESLLSYWDNPKAREVLVRSIISQNSPIVQSAIADAMLTLREKDAISEFKQLIEEDKVNEAIKSKIENTIDQLISI